LDNSARFWPFENNLCLAFIYTAAFHGLRPF
jgi:hypothetical protein